MSTAYAQQLGVYLDSGMAPGDTPVPLWASHDPDTDHHEWHLREDCWARPRTTTAPTVRPLRDVVAELRDDDSEATLCDECTDERAPLAQAVGLDDDDACLVRTLVPIQARLDADDAVWPVDNTCSGLTRLAEQRTARNPQLAAYTAELRGRLLDRHQALVASGRAAADQAKAAATMAPKVAWVALQTAGWALPDHEAAYRDTIGHTAREREASEREASDRCRTRAGEVTLERLRDSRELDALHARTAASLTEHSCWVWLDPGVRASFAYAHGFALALDFDPDQPQLVRVPTGLLLAARLPSVMPVVPALTYLAPGNLPRHAVWAAHTLATDPSQVTVLAGAVLAAEV